jgi:hypothetical protein
MISQAPMSLTITFPTVYDGEIGVQFEPGGGTAHLHPYMVVRPDLVEIIDLLASPIRVLCVRGRVDDEMLHQITLRCPQLVALAVHDADGRQLTIAGISSAARACTNLALLGIFKCRCVRSSADLATVATVADTHCYGANNYVCLITPLSLSEYPSL